MSVVTRLYVLLYQCWPLSLRGHRCIASFCVSPRRCGTRGVFVTEPKRQVFHLPRIDRFRVNFLHPWTYVPEDFTVISTAVSIKIDLCFLPNLPIRFPYNELNRPSLCLFGNRTQIDPAQREGRIREVVISMHFGARSCDRSPFQMGHLT
jgi:hypothetical protein